MITTYRVDLGRDGAEFTNYLRSTLHHADIHGLVEENDGVITFSREVYDHLRGLGSHDDGVIDDQDRMWVGGVDWRVTRLEDTDPVGLAEIAQRLGVKRDTADRWRQRGVLPPHEWIVGGRPAWPWPRIERWARETGRLT